MNQDQQPRPWWSEHWPLLVLVALVVVLAVLVGLGYWFRWSWTGFTGSGVSPPKLIWDWLELLIVPIVLGAGALWFNQQARKGEQRQRENELKIADQQRRNELELADQQRKEDSLQRYLDRMQELILDKGLRKPERDAEIRSLSRARTLAVLRTLDGNRKGQLVRFLYEADLIGKGVREESGEWRVIEAIIDLQTSDLSNADLTRADLSNADLSGTDLSNADLRVADLRGAFLSNARLLGADLSAAHLIGADLSYASLRGAYLIAALLFGADLSDADLSDADLRGAFLSNTDLSGAELRGADLSEADLSNARGWTSGELAQELAQASSLVGATLPDGRKISTEEAWEEFKKRYKRSSWQEEDCIMNEEFSE